MNSRYHSLTTLLTSSLICALVVPLPAEGAPAKVDCSSAVQIELQPKPGIAAGLQGELVLRPIEGGGEPVTLPSRVGTPNTTKLPCDSQWEVTSTFPESWAPRTLLVVGSSKETVTSRITLWPLGRLAGSVKVVEKGQRPPKRLVVTTLAPRPPAPKDVPKGSLDCPVDAQGKWECPPLPATIFDLVLSAEGFIPHYRWEVKVLPGKAADLGILKLERGASVAGWVDVEGGRIGADCRARLIPLVAPGSGARIAEKVRSTGNEVPVRKDGFFQLVGVAPGNYSLEVRQEGFAPATVHPIEVWPRSETFLREPVTLKRPIRLELVVSPASDWLGRPWKVEVYRASEGNASFRDEVYAGPTDDQGVVAIANQPPARFRVHVSDSLDNRFEMRDFDVNGPEEARQVFDLEILTVQGTVKLGKEPLAATLWFGGRHGSPGTRMESDQEGKFHGVLARDGWWRVDVSSSTPKFETRTRVKVEPDGQDRATVEIDLPGTRVFGKILDDTGRPLPSASFEISTEGVDMHTTTDETGSFDVRGLSEGMAFAGATFSQRDEEWVSDRISLFLRDGGEVGPIELRLKKKKRVSGTVRSALGPVPGAGIRVLPIHPVKLLGGDAVRTELDGSFTAQVPEGTETAAVIVSPPGHALSAFLLSLGEVPQQPLMVSLEGGDLEVAVPERAKVEEEGLSLWVFQNGLLLPIQTLYEWATGHGKNLYVENRYAVPALAPGEYRACLVPQAAVIPWQDSGWTAPLARCVTGQLTAGGTLRLDLSSAD